LDSLPGKSRVQFGASKSLASARRPARIRLDSRQKLLPFLLAPGRADRVLFEAVEHDRGLSTILRDIKAPVTKGRTVTWTPFCLPSLTAKPVSHRTIFPLSCPDHRNGSCHPYRLRNYYQRGTGSSLLYFNPAVASLPPFTLPSFPFFTSRLSLNSP